MGFDGFFRSRKALRWVLTAMIMPLSYHLLYLSLSLHVTDSGDIHLIRSGTSAENSSVECFDLLIPFHVSDASTFLDTGGLASIQRHIQGWRKTFIISAENSSLVGVLDEKTVWVPESRFSGLHVLYGWYFQQALKLLAPRDMEDLCNTFLVLDADLHFVRDWDFRREQGKWDYLFPPAMPGGHLQELAEYAERSTKDFIAHDSLMHGHTLCTVHHHMIMQKEVIAALEAHVQKLHGRTLLEKMVEAQSTRTWISEFDIYLSFLWNSIFRERIHLVDFPYIHARDKGQCTNQDADTLRNASNIVFMACHDHYVGDDICVGSLIDCSSKAALCQRQPDGMCQWRNVAPCDLLQI